MSKTNEWDLLKHQFDALMHDESVGAESIDKIFDAQFRRRFAELMNRLPNAMAHLVISTGPKANDLVGWEYCTRQ